MRWVLRLSGFGFAAGGSILLVQSYLEGGLLNRLIGFVAWVAALLLWAGSRSPAQAERVECEGERITAHRRGGHEESILWADLAEVRIVTTDEGPWCEDIYWLLTSAGNESGCAVPGQAEGVIDLLNRLQELPGFDNEAVVEAMGSTKNASFLCWKRDP